MAAFDDGLLRFLFADAVCKSELVEGYLGH
jgi:hypothetical protein